MTAARRCGTTISARSKQIGDPVTVSQFDQHGKEYLTDPLTPLIDSWADCNVGHTFAIPGLGLFVPVASPNAQLSANNLCSSSPCVPERESVRQGDLQLHDPGPSRRFPLAVPGSCGGGFLDGNSGPMQTLGYMMGEMDVVS